MHSNNATIPNGLFLFVDDDKDEHELLKLAVKALKLNNKIVSCFNGAEALEFLKSTKEDIFLILSDLNMPVMDGLEFKSIIESTPEIKAKAIPFFFHSSTSSSAEIRSAYRKSIQGFIRKADSLDGTIATLQKIVALWTDIIHPKDLN